jgi:hypothetical protein
VVRAQTVLPLPASLVHPNISDLEIYALMFVLREPTKTKSTKLVLLVVKSALNAKMRLLIAPSVLEE